MILSCEVLESPIGEVQILTDRDGTLWSIEFDCTPEDQLKIMEHFHRGESIQIEPSGAESQAFLALQRYFGGDLKAIEGLPVCTGGTEFQSRVWQELLKIPVGSVISYGELAERIGNPKAVRAVGLANGANPISIVIPCHRVIGSDRSLTGYGGGLPRKKWLLEHEGAMPAETHQPRLFA